MKVGYRVYVLGVMIQASVSQLISEQALEALKGKTLINSKEVRVNVGFENPFKDPYPKLWYNTPIDESVDCFVEYGKLPDGSLDKSQYALRSLSNSTYEQNLIDSQADVSLFRTHRRQCGACSSLDDLYVYLKYPDLTSPVKKCTMRLQDGKIIKCLRELGFSEDCAQIWFWNAKNTRKTHANGGCLGTCLARVLTPNNQPRGTFNPCQPKETFLNAHEFDQDLGQSLDVEGDLEADQTVPGPKTEIDRMKQKSGILWLQQRAGKSGYFQPQDQKSQNKRGYCDNRINGEPACSPDQWQNGPFRLNPCLQCDECRSGPVFQRVAGRTRRHSGIVSAIERPGVWPMDHNYG